MSTQPRALALAGWHDAMADEPKRNQSKREKHRATAAELRRLSALNAQLLSALELWIDPFDGDALELIASEYGKQTADRVDIARYVIKAAEEA